MKIRLSLLLLLTLSMGISGAVRPQERPIRVAFLDPNPSYPFWKLFTSVMQDAANDLDMELDHYAGLEWSTQNEALLRKIIKGPNKPDYLVLTVHQGSKVRLFELANQAKIPFFVVDAGLLAPERKRYGGPRQHFKYWIGQMLPDNEKAGYDLAIILANEALKKKERVEMVGFGGIPNDFAAIERRKGLERAVAKRKDIDLKQIITADWLFAQTQTITPLMMRRYPKISAIWAAGDAMALGTLKPLRDKGFQPGKRIAIGGIDWTQPAIDAVKRGEMSATIGGHFLYGGWTMVLLYDYHHGRDFASEQTDWRPKMTAITQNNWSRYQRLIDHTECSKIDFRKFSKTLNPRLKHYDFSNEAAITQLKKETPEGASKITNRP